MSYARRHSTNVCPGNRVRYSLTLKPCQPIRSLRSKFSTKRLEPVLSYRALSLPQQRSRLKLTPRKPEGLMRPESPRRR